MTLTIDDDAFDDDGFDREVIDLTVLEAREVWAEVSAHDFDDRAFGRLLAAISEVDR